jgi:putative multiple sugar transport system substrate-binding protein
MNRRRLLLSLSAPALLATSRLAGAVVADKGLIGVSMPTFSSRRWVDDGLSMMRTLNRLNYTVDLQYAINNAGDQPGQVQKMMDAGAKVVVIGASDSSAFTAVLDNAAKKGVKVIAYDRLIRDSGNVDAYATFDNFEVGVLQGRDIETRLKLRDGGKGLIELFAGAADDNNSHFFYNGAMSVLKPYIDAGALTVGSGKVAMAEVATPQWSGAIAKARLQAMLKTLYAKRRLDAILSPNDNTSVELLTALQGVGYGTAQPWPVVTGQDAEVNSVRSIQRGEQSSTVFKDTRQLAVRVASMVDEYMSGKAPTINDAKTYNNGVKVVPSYLLKPVFVNKENWQQVLVNSGFYQSGQL